MARTASAAVKSRREEGRIQESHDEGEGRGEEGGCEEEGRRSPRRKVPAAKAGATAAAPKVCAEEKAAPSGSNEGVAAVKVARAARRRRPATPRRWRAPRAAQGRGTSAEGRGAGATFHRQSSQRR